MYAELNIGLNVNGDNSDLAVSARAVKAIFKLRESFEYVAFERKESQYEGPDGAVAETTLVVGMSVPVALGDVRDAIAKLSVMLEQDCVALYFPVDKKGYLCGPAANKWGAFKIKDFTRYADLVDTPPTQGELFA